MRGRRSEQRTGRCPYEPATPTPLTNEGNLCRDSTLILHPPLVVSTPTLMSYVMVALCFLYCLLPLLLPICVYFVMLR